MDKWILNLIAKEEEQSKEEMENASQEEKEKWFEERTAKHIELVKKYALRIVTGGPEFRQFDNNLLLENVEFHDASKLIEPERTPYIGISWRHKFDNYKSYKKPGTLPNKEENAATETHILNNKHHPEFWQDKKENLINPEDRNAPPTEMVDATKMPSLYLAEMVADWCSMSEELGINSPREWADKNVNIRWKFTDKQKDLIYKLIDVAWKDEDVKKKSEEK